VILLGRCDFGRKKYAFHNQVTKKKFARVKLKKRRYLSLLIFQHRPTLTEVFRAFSSVVRQMPGYKSPRRGTARTLPITFLCCSMYCFLCCSIYCFFFVVLRIVCVYMCTVLLPPAGNPIAVNKYININIPPYTFHFLVPFLFFPLHFLYFSLFIFLISVFIPLFLQCPDPQNRLVTVLNMLCCVGNAK
jgi:hypothetical protein